MGGKRIIIHGVYKIVNIVNGMIYVGSSKDITDRFHGHKYELRRNKHGNMHLQYAWNKYGESSFSFEIIEETVLDKLTLLYREQYWMDTLQSYDREFGYNKEPKAGSSLGVKRSAETLAKISLSKKGVKLGSASEERKKKISQAIMGIVRSEETKAKIRVARAKQIMKPVSDETKQKIAEKHVGRKATPEQRKNMSSARMGKEPWNKGVAGSASTYKKTSL